MRYLWLLAISLFIPACERGIKIESSSTTTPLPEFFGAGQENPEVQAVLDKFTPEQITQMFLDIPISDHRPESEKSFELLSKAMKAIERGKGDPRLQKADRVNEKLRGL